MARNFCFSIAIGLIRGHPTTTYPKLIPLFITAALVSVTTFGYTGYLANTLAFPADVFPKGAVASVWGLASMGSGFGGMLFMGLSGWLIGRFGYTPVFIGYGILPLLALFCVLFLIGPLRPDVRFQRNFQPILGPKTA